VSDGPERRLFVLTGGPCSGKSTTLIEIGRRGHETIPEAAARIILEGKLHPARDSLAFQREVLRRQIAAEAAAPERPVFVDRGVGDHYGYLAYYLARRGIDLLPEFGEELDRAWQDALPRYRAVFFLAPNPTFRPEAYRREDAEEALLIHRSLSEAYRARHPRVIEVPWGPVGDRADSILAAASVRSSVL
jgi:predicted ATPase